MKRKIEFTMDIDPSVSSDDLYEWARYQLGERGSMALSNSMADKEIEADWGSVRIGEA